jgi:hypothetical protein
MAFRNVFKAGASHYGVADLQLLAAETHKFESRCAALRAWCLFVHHLLNCCVTRQAPTVMGASNHVKCASINAFDALACRYLDGLIGRWPEDKQIYKERSPINALDQFDEPVVFFQVSKIECAPPALRTHAT